MRTVEVLVFEGCPNVDEAVHRVRAAIARARVDATVRLVHVTSEDEARSLRFLGSPTVRVDGNDVDASALQRVDFGLQCRVYAVAGKIHGAPPAAWIEASLLGHPLESIEGTAAASCCSPKAGG